MRATALLPWRAALLQITASTPNRHRSAALGPASEDNTEGVHDNFAWVAEERLPPVATGDFHRAEHLASWKTLLACGIVTSS
jgi:hypothetical protein